MDGFSRLTNIRTPFGVATFRDYSFDALRQSVTTVIGDFIALSYTKNFETVFGHVASDQVNGVSVNYTYDNDELMTGAGALALTYDVPNGLLSGTTLGTLTDTYNYNNFGEFNQYKVLNNGTTVLYTLNVIRDSLGRITTKRQKFAGTPLVQYEYAYDSVGRLSAVLKNGVAAANYVYDDNGNRISGDIGGAAVSATYDDQDRLTQYNTFTYTYNANGDLQTKLNTLTSELTQYSYDVFGNLKQVVLPNGTVVRYRFDAFNRRISRFVNNVAVKHYIYDTEGVLVGELNPSGVVRRYVYASKSNVPDYFIEGGQSFRIISDHLGSPREVIDSSGVIVYRMDHDEFGRVILDTNPGFLPFGFAGGLYDASTGLVRFGARDYDSEVGRWTAKDPILFDSGDLNLYGYVASDPINKIDSNGKSWGFVVGSIVLGLAVHEIYRYIRGEPMLFDQIQNYIRRKIGPEIRDILNIPDSDVSSSDKSFGKMCKNMTGASSNL